MNIEGEPLERMNAVEKKHAKLTKHRGRDESLSERINKAVFKSHPGLVL